MGGGLAAAEEIPDAFDLPCGPVPVQEAFEAPWSNLSVYAGRFAAIRAPSSSFAPTTCSASGT